MTTIHPMQGQSNPEGLLTCPYDQSHQISLKRMQFHIAKCRKGHPDVKRECPYNATHMINEREYQFHLEVCPNRGIVDNFIYAMPNENVHVIELPPEPFIPPSEENWDDEYCGTYEPAKKTAEAPIIHGLIGGTPSERKKCRNQQRQKFRALDDSVSTSSFASEVVKQKKPAPDVTQPLRRPNTKPSTHGQSSSELASLNQSFASVLSQATVSTVKKEGKRPAVSSGSDEDKIPNLEPAITRTGNRSRRLQTADGDSILIRPKGRGKLK